ncbi:MAG: hypothetical protein EOR73_32005 [Mesorhizobium sp.]|nr:MAG: hypothetical protein EOR73_32005 [Mesorhizobium sp.]
MSGNLKLSGVKSAPIQPLALYGAVEGALESGFVAAELDHVPRAKDILDLYIVNRLDDIPF